MGIKNMKYKCCVTLLDELLGFGHNLNVEKKICVPVSPVISWGGLKNPCARGGHQVIGFVKMPA